MWSVNLLHPVSCNWLSMVIHSVKIAKQNTKKIHCFNGSYVSFQCMVREVSVVIMFCYQFAFCLPASQFYAPWCGHCRKLAPIYHQVYLALQETEITVAKVDATRYSVMASQYDIRGYPTIKLWVFRLCYSTSLLAVFKTFTAFKLYEMNISVPHSARLQPLRCFEFPPQTNKQKTKPKLGSILMHLACTRLFYNLVHLVIRVSSCN